MSIAKRIRKKIGALKKKFLLLLSKEERLESMVGPFGAWKATRNFQYNFLIQRGLMKGHQFLDIGCGPLRGGYPIIKYLNQGCYTGIDIRPKAINIAKKMIKRGKLCHKQPRLMVSNSFGKQELSPNQFLIRQNHIQHI